MKLDAVGDPFTLAMVAYDWRNGNLRIPFGSSSAPGDSGSALYVYDNLDKKWYAVGVVSKSDCDGNYETLCSQVQYTLINDELIEELKEPKSVFIKGGAYRFDSAGKLLDSNGGDLGAHTILDSVAGENLWHNINNKGNYAQRLQAMKASKDLYFSDSGTLSLEKDIDLGAGVLVFGKDSVWSIENTGGANNGANNGVNNSTGNNANPWFLHGGIYADSGARITYNVATKKDDFLHKLGEGTLIVTSSSPDAGLG